MPVYAVNNLKAIVNINCEACGHAYSYPHAIEISGPGAYTEAGALKKGAEYYATKCLEVEAKIKSYQIRE